MSEHKEKLIEASPPKKPVIFGVMGKILWVDLTTKNIVEEPVPEEIYRKYLGGYGLATYYLYQRIPKDADPLGPENILAFMPGLFTGTVAPFTGRYMVCAKSPLTGKGLKADGTESKGGWGDSNSGGFFGPAIKRAGYDGIFITGASEKPVYLYIDEKGPQILDADELWGKDAVETDLLLQKKYGKSVNVAAIGKAGENLSLIAGIVNDKGRIAARSGLGAVMGSKKLKAICLKGKAKIPVKDNKKAIALSKKYRQKVNKNFDVFHAKMALKMGPSLAKILRWMKMGFFGDVPIYAQYFHEYGTSYSTAMSAEIGDMPIKNHKGIGYIDWPQEVARKFSGIELIKYKKRSFGCFGCPVACGAILSIPEIGLEETHRPEYETLGSFGGLILNGDINTLFEVNEYLNREGMDSISAGTTIAFVLECVEQGILKKEDFKCKEFPDGFLPHWGESQYIMPLLRMMINREGIGDILADGTWIAARKIGKGSETFAMNVNGQEIPMHDPRMMTGLALTYVADPTPARHTAACLEFSAMGPHNQFLKEINYKDAKKAYEKGVKQAHFAKFKQSFNALGFCEFAIWNGRYPLWGLLNAIFGWDLSLKDIEEIGHRIQTLRQMFNAREGAIRHEMPKRAMGDPPLKKGPLKNKSVDVQSMILGYYRTIGFQDNGVPKESTLRELGLDFCIPDLPHCTGAPKPLINETLLKKMKEVLPADTQAEETEATTQTEIKSFVKVNLAGSFEGRPMNTQFIVEIEGENAPQNIKDILKWLNKENKMKIFSEDSIKKGTITVMHNGVRIDENHLGDPLKGGDVITIIQPVFGG